MATIHRENIGVLNDRITVEVTTGDYLPRFEKALKEYAKKASLPGFRKGMVPSGLIKKMHGQSILTEEVVKTVETELTNYLTAENLPLFGQPIAENQEELRIDAHAPQNYRFDFEIGIKPAFTITPLEKDFRFTRYQVRVEDKEVDEEVKRLQKKAGETKEKETVSGDEDILSVAVTEADAQGKPLEDTEPRNEKFVLSYFAPALRDRLTGGKKGDILPVTLKEAFEQNELEWVTRNWKLEEDEAEKPRLLEITKVEEIIPKPLSEDLFNEVYPGSGIQTEEEFRERIRQDDERYWAQEAGKRLDNDIFETLVHGTPLELPEGYFRKLLKQGDGKRERTDEEVDRSYGSFEHEMRWSVISGKIASENGIDVAAEELRDSFKERLKAYFGAGAAAVEDERLDQFADSMMKDEKAVNEAYGKLLTGKLFQWLRDKAEIEEKEVTADEFLALSHNHHHHEHDHEHA